MNERMLTLSVTTFKLEKEPNVEVSLLGLTLKCGDLAYPISLIVEAFSENQVMKTVNSHGLMSHTLYEDDMRNTKANFIKLDWILKKKECRTTVDFDEKKMNIYQAVLPLLGKKKTIECFNLLGLSFDNPKVMQSIIGKYENFGAWS